MDANRQKEPTMTPEQHHEDCDYRLSSQAREIEQTFGLPESTDIFDCNLDCEGLDSVA